MRSERRGDHEKGGDGIFVFDGRMVMVFAKAQK